MPVHTLPWGALPSRHCMVMLVISVFRGTLFPLSPMWHMLAERSTVLAAVHQHLLRAQQRMKHQADKRGCEPSFNIDDYVYLRL